MPARAAVIGADAAPAPVLNVVSVDVEEHFQVSAFEQVVDRDDWSRLESRVEANTDRLLELFDEQRCHATFFILGWVAERHPALVRRIAAAGHEIACHGHEHRLVYDLTPEAFRSDLRRSLEAIGEAAGAPARAYRAASFSITRRSLWALDVLAEEGIEVDSSLFPVRHDRYGVPGMPRGLYRLRTPGGQRLLEVPPTTVRLAGMTLPALGGGYLRIFPEAYSRWAIRRLNDVEAQPAIVYLHPWEVDPDQPRIEGAPLRSRLRHYTGLDRMLGRLRRLLEAHSFGSIAEMLERLEEPPEEIAIGDSLEARGS